MQPAILKAILQAKSRKLPSALVTILDDGQQAFFLDGQISGNLTLPAAILPDITNAVMKDKSKTVDLNGSRYFIQVFNPPKRLIIIGAVHISQALAPIAKIAGFDVIIIDPRTAWATQERFPNQIIDTNWPDEAIESLNIDSRTAIVSLTHDPKLDDPALEYAIRSKAFYIGALGSKKTHGKRVQRLEEAGFSEDEIKRIDGPIGMDIGAVTPAEIAVSIMAQLTLSLNGPRH